jgi:hypothetical protein
MVVLPKPGTLPFAEASGGHAVVHASCSFAVNSRHE